MNLNIAAIEKGFGFSKPYRFDLSFHTYSYIREKGLCRTRILYMEKMIWKSGKIAREETLYINRDDKEQ